MSLEIGRKHPSDLHTPPPPPSTKVLALGPEGVTLRLSLGTHDQKDR